MILVDINLLLYAVNEDDAHHSTARAWLEQQLSGTTPFGLSWIVILGFIRLSTNPRVIPKPLSREDALEKLNHWLEQPCVHIIWPGDKHWDIFQAALKVVGRSTNWVTDAHLAAMAIERNCILYSADAGFEKFPGLRWQNPMTSPQQ